MLKCPRFLCRKCKRRTFAIMRQAELKYKIIELISQINDESTLKSIFQDVSRKTKISSGTLRKSIQRGKIESGQSAATSQNWEEISEWS